MKEATPVIGTEPAPVRRYVVDGYTFKQRASSEYRLDEQDPLFGVIGKLGLTDRSNFDDSTIISYFDKLEDSGAVLDAMEMLLEFDDPNFISKRFRLIRMRAFGDTKRSILARMTRGQAAAVLQHFFLMNFSLTPQ